MSSTQNNRDRVLRWQKKNLELVHAKQKRHQDKMRIEVLTHYGGKCACCGYSDLTTKIYGKSFLQIDHINGNGNQHVKSLGVKGFKFYQWLRRLWPTGFRVLCAGCNVSMRPGEEKCELHKHVI